MVPLQYPINHTAVDRNDRAFTPTLCCCQLQRNSVEVRSRIQYDSSQTTWQRIGNKMVAQQGLINTHTFGQSIRRTRLHSSLFANDTLPARIHKCTQIMILVIPAGMCKYCSCQWVFTIASNFFIFPATTFAVSRSEVMSLFCFSLSPKHISTNVSGSESTIGSGRSYWRPVNIVVLKKSSPVTGMEWPRGFQEVKVPRYHDNGIGWCLVSLTHRLPLPPGNTPGTNFCKRLGRPQGHSAIGRIMSMKNSNYTTWNWTSDLLICSTAP